MPAPKAKTAASTNGASAKSKGGKSSSGTSTPVTSSAPQETVSTTSYGSGRPDKAAYDAEQETIKKDIESAQAKLSAVREKISLATKGGNGNDRRAQLKAELDSIRGQQAGNKSSRGKILDQIKTLQDGLQKKIKDLNAAKAKVPFKTVAEVDAQIKKLDQQVESGSLTLAAEKRALQDITTYKRNRRTVETFQADQESIEADKRAVEELRKQLDDPESKAISERYDAIKAELDELKKESDEAYAGRNKLFSERDTLQEQINTFYNAKRESAQKFKDANDRYWSKVNEDRARRAEKARAQRAADEQAKKIEIAERLREEAAIPAFQAQIEDCQTLIDYFSGKNSGNTYSSTPASLVPKSELAGVAKLEIRKVEAEPQEGLVARKKKGEEEENYFVGKSKKGKKGGAAAKPSATEPSTSAASSSQLNVPLPTLSALLSMSIPPPSSSADVPRVVEDLKTKKSWFEANQARVTAENIAKAEADIQRLTNGAKADGKADGPSATELTPPNGGGERPAEPAHTPQSSDLASTAVPSEEVVDKLEEVKEQEAEAEA